MQTLDLAVPGKGEVLEYPRKIKDEDNLPVTGNSGSRNSLGIGKIVAYRLDDDLLFTEKLFDNNADFFLREANDDDVEIVDLADISRDIKYL